VMSQDIGIAPNLHLGSELVLCAAAADLSRLVVRGRVDG
jgi:hypothetical protein